jgi:type II restriction enzyme
MILQMQATLGANYKSPTQQARVITESWMSNHGYCAACLSPLTPAANNAKAVDFACSSCAIQYQLKSSKTKIGMRVPDGAYETMLSAVRGDTCPALVLMHYRKIDWTVRDLIIIPSFALTEQAIIPRKPLASTAKRAGWIGCNIDLSQIAQQARVHVVKQGVVNDQAEVADSYARLKPLQSISVKQRGWAMGVLNGIQNLGLTKFTTQDAYQLVNSMARIFPGNRNIRPKIRQQLQVLRDMELLVHLERGFWSLPRVE